MEDPLPTSCRPVLPSSDEGVLALDDFEDGDLQLERTSGFHGTWYVANDGTGQQTPALAASPADLLVDGQGSPGSPGYALHTSGQGFTRWGALVGARLNAVGSQACTFDLSTYAGIQLSAKGEGRVHLNVGTVPTTPIVDGGACTLAVCSDYGQIIELAAEWQAISVPFADLTQPSWATATSWDPASALRIAFWSEQPDFDIWLDEIRLYR